MEIIHSSRYMVAKSMDLTDLHHLFPYIMSLVQQYHKKEIVLPPVSCPFCRRLVSVSHRHCSSALPSLSPDQSDWSLPTISRFSRELCMSLNLLSSSHLLKQISCLSPCFTKAGWPHRDGSSVRSPLILCQVQR